VLRRSRSLGQQSLLHLDIFHARIIATRHTDLVASRIYRSGRDPVIRSSGDCRSGWERSLP
jgi:hypothetical protein